MLQLRYLGSQSFKKKEKNEKVLQVSGTQGWFLLLRNNSLLLWKIFNKALPLWLAHIIEIGGLTSGRLWMHLKWTHSNFSRGLRNRTKWGWVRGLGLTQSLSAQDNERTRTCDNQWVALPRYPFRTEAFDPAAESIVAGKAQSSCWLEEVTLPKVTPSPRNSHIY